MSGLRCVDCGSDRATIYTVKAKVFTEPYQIPLCPLCAKEEKRATLLPPGEETRQ